MQFQKDAVQFPNSIGRLKTERPPKKEAGVAAGEAASEQDLLERLVNMPVNAETAPSYEAELLTYDFDRGPYETPRQMAASMAPGDGSLLVDGLQNVVGMPVLSEVLPIEKQTNSEIGSTHESESIHGYRSDRLERKANFTVLHEHINDLTEENCDLKRALELQQRLTSNLTQENQTLGDEYNIQAQKLEELQKTSKQYEILLQEQHQALEAAKRERELSSAAEQGIQERVTALVQENIALEEKLRDARVSEIRLEKSLEALKEEADDVARRERKAENENRHLTDILNNIREENNLLRAQMHTPKRYGTTSSSTRMVDVEIQVETEVETSSPAEEDATASGEVTEGQISDEDILKMFVMDRSTELNAEEQLILDSVYELINALDDQRKAMIAKLRAAKEEIEKLKKEKTVLTEQWTQQETAVPTVIGDQSQISEHRPSHGSSNDTHPQATTRHPSQERRGFFGWFGGRNKPTNAEHDMS